MNRLRLLPLCAAVLLNGCGSWHMLRSDDTASTAQLSLKGTYCQSLPRVYGGVVWDMCQLYGEPPANGAAQGYAPPPSPSGSGRVYTAVILPFLDLPLSGIADTLALPYTLYRQNRDGSIELTRDD